MNKFMSNRHTIKPLLLVESAATKTSSSSATIPPDSMSLLCDDTGSPSPAISTAVNTLPAQSQRSVLASTSSSRRALLLEEEVDDPIVRPTRRRRNNPRKDVIADLVSAMKEDLEKQDRRRAKAQELDSNLIEVLRDFLEKQ